MQRKLIIQKFKQLVRKSSLPQIMIKSHHTGHACSNYGQISQYLVDSFYFSGYTSINFFPSKVIWVIMVNQDINNWPINHTSFHPSTHSSIFHPITDLHCIHFICILIHSLCIYYSSIHSYYAPSINQSKTHPSIHSPIHQCIYPPIYPINQAQPSSSDKKPDEVF